MQMVGCTSAWSIVAHRVMTRRVFASVITHMKRGILYIAVLEALLTGTCLMVMHCGSWRVGLPDFGWEVVEEAPVGEGYGGNYISSMCKSNTVVDACHEEVGVSLYISGRIQADVT